MSAYKKIVKREGKTPVFLCSSGPNGSYKLPELDQIKDTVLYDPDDIEESGRKFMKLILERCSGNFVAGMRDVMFENPKISKYTPTVYE